MADDMASYFDTSAKMVHSYAKRLEKEGGHLRVHFDERPVVSTFIAIFTLLSLVPVAIFSTTSLFTLVLFVLAALTFALIAAAGVILTFFGFLAAILIGILFTSIFLTSVALASYFILRLALHIRHDGPLSGISAWGKEIKRVLLVGGKDAKAENIPLPQSPLGDSDEDSESGIKKRKEYTIQEDEDNSHMIHDYASAVKYGETHADTQE